MNSTYDPYTTPTETGVPYDLTMPKIWGWDKWWEGQYPSNSDWDPSWCATVMYDQNSRNKPVGPTPSFSYNKPGKGLSQNVWIKPEDWTPIYLIGGAGLLYRYIYK